MKLPAPKWCTTVYPDEYDYIGQFSDTVKIANRRKEQFAPMDVGKVWGLVLAYQEAQKENLEQARLLGMSGEREADLLGKIERLEKQPAQKNV